MSVKVESTMAWLPKRRHGVYLAQTLMAAWFDLEGALADDQIGLASFALQSVLVTALELHVRATGVEPAASINRPEHIAGLLRALDRQNPELAEQTWRLIDAPIPEDIAQAGLAVEAAVAFMCGPLAVPAAASREAATRAWADGTRELRTIARGFGIAQAEDWYLPDADAEDDRLDWYDEIMKHLERGDRAES